MVTITDAAAGAQVMQCRALQAAGRYAEALALARDILDRAGDDGARWRAHTAIGILCMMMELFAESIAAHTAALALARGNDFRVAAGWTNLGAVFLCASAWDLAIECLSRVTENPAHCRALPPYVAHGNMAICHLHLDNVREGLLAVRQAFRIETPAIVAGNSHGPVLFRHTFVQLAMLSNRVPRAEIEQRAAEAAAIEAADPQGRNRILVDAMAAEMEIAWGDRLAGIARLRGLLPAARECPQILSDVLFALVHAERLAGRPGNAAAYLAEWANHLFPEGPAMAAGLGVRSWLEPGITIREQLEQIVIPLPLPDSLRQLLGQP